MNAQRELFLNPRPATEIIEERLADFVAESNEHTIEPERRIILYAEITRLRAMLGKVGDR